MGGEPVNIEMLCEELDRFFSVAREDRFPWLLAEKNAVDVQIDAYHLPSYRHCRERSERALTTDFTDVHGWEKKGIFLSVFIREIRG